jgi:hypothetical protein
MILECAATMVTVGDSAALMEEVSLWIADNLAYVTN